MQPSRFIAVVMLALALTAAPAAGAQAPGTSPAGAAQVATSATAAGFCLGQMSTGAAEPTVAGETAAGPGSTAVQPTSEAGAAPAESTEQAEGTRQAGETMPAEPGGQPALSPEPPTGPWMVTCQNDRPGSAFLLGERGATQTLAGGGEKGSFAYFLVYHRADGDTPLRLTYTPADPITNQTFGINVYSPSGAHVVKALGVGRQGNRLGVAETSIPTDRPGWYTVQVFNYGTVPIQFTLQGVAEAPEPALTALVGIVSGS